MQLNCKAIKKWQPCSISTSTCPPPPFQGYPLFLAKFLVIFKVINKDCLYFINKICIVVVIIRDETRRIVWNISITINKIYTKGVLDVFFTPMVTLDFILHKALVIFSKSPKKNTSFAFRDSFLAPRKLA